MNFLPPRVLRWALFALQIVCLAGATQAQTRSPLVAVLVHGTENAHRARVDALREGMREHGYAEGRSYALVLRWSDGRIERLPGLARELLALKPDVAVGANVLSAQAFWRESKTVPIVMAGGAGALQSGLIASLARPGGTVTGSTNQGEDLTQKLFELLNEIAPGAKRVMTLSSGRGLVEPDVRAASRAAAGTLRLSLIEAFANSPEEIRGLAAQCERERCEALVVLLDPTLLSWRADVVAFAAQRKIPAIYSNLEYAEDQGLMAYATDQRQGFRRAAYFIDRILKGAKPADLPVEQPTKFEFVVNLKTAKSLGLTFPPAILLRVTEVIE